MKEESSFLFFLFFNKEYTAYFSSELVDAGFFHTLYRSRISIAVDLL
jgi:hypothetical protein